jgi:hypothetical protein
MLIVEFDGYLYRGFEARTTTTGKLVYTARIGLRNSSSSDYLWVDLEYWPEAAGNDALVEFRKKFGVYPNEFKKGHFVRGKGSLHVRSSGSNNKYHSIRLQELRFASPTTETSDIPSSVPVKDPVTKEPINSSMEEMPF